MTVVNLDIFRDARLIVEGNPIVNRRGMIEWTITGENQEAVERAAHHLMALADAGTSSFTFPHRIIDRTEAKYGWYRAKGFTHE
jgi:hypothetical protein